MLKAALVAAGIFSFIGVEARSMPQDTVGKKISHTAKKVGHATAHDATTAGHATAHAAATADAAVANKRYDGKYGPHGEAVYINKHSHYFYVNKTGHRVYLKKSQLRDKPE